MCPMELPELLTALLERRISQSCPQWCPELVDCSRGEALRCRITCLFVLYTSKVDWDYQKEELDALVLQKGHGI